MSGIVKSGASIRKTIAVGIGLTALAAGGGYWLGARQHLASSAATAENDRKILYYYDPMVPDQHFDRPGKSPFMDMQLVPRYADEEPTEAGVKVDSSIIQNLGVRLANVARGPISRSVIAAGVIAFNERDVAVVQARTGGFVERSHKRALGDVVARGAPLVDIRVPEWTAAQAEYLALRGGDAALAVAARQRLRMLGMPETLIRRVEADNAPSPIFTVTAPIAGAITALEVRDGMTIAPGAHLATISGVSPVWLVVSVPQASAGRLTRGDAVKANLAAYPSETFSGQIENVLPAANSASRTVEVRIAFANPNVRLRPGMTAQAQLSKGEARTALLVPTESVIRTGRRNLVIVASDNGRFVPVEVILGESAGPNIEVRQGLREGQKVVSSGQFLIDSEASLSGVLARLGASAPNAEGSSSYDANGRIQALNGRNVTLAHGPVPALSWPAMTMEFSLADSDLARNLRVGDMVSFHFRQGGAGYVIDKISKDSAQ